MKGDAWLGRNSIYALIQVTFNISHSHSFGKLKYAMHLQYETHRILKE
jgi:hypothetical protein